MNEPKPIESKIWQVEMEVRYYGVTMARNRDEAIKNCNRDGYYGKTVTLKYCTRAVVQVMHSCGHFYNHPIKTKTKVLKLAKAICPGCAADKVSNRA